jgi:hypothetical protein
VGGGGVFEGMGWVVTAVAATTSATITGSVGVGSTSSLIQADNKLTKTNKYKIFLII